MVSQRACVWCGHRLAGSRAKEHVVPDWLLRHLNVGSETVEATIAATADENVVSVRRHMLDAMREGRVCEECNCGWMSDLEQAAKPVLVPVIDGRRSVLTLSASERRLVARWAAKTAFMLNSSSDQSDMGMHVPDDHFTLLRTHPDALPSGVGVFTAHGPGSRDFSWVQENKWPQFFVTPIEDDRRHIARAYKIGLQFRRLLLCVAFWPHAEWTFVVASGVHVPLWPQLRFYFAYPAESCPGGVDSFEALRWFSALVAVVEFRVPMNSGLGQSVRSVTVGGGHAAGEKESPGQ